MPRTPVLLAWSGGKDAAWALHVLRQRDDVDVVALLSTATEPYQRAAMQGVRVDVLQAQAASAGLPLRLSWIPAGCDNATYLQRFGASLALAGAEFQGLACIAFGDLLLADIKAWREAQCDALGWQALFPLFGSDTRALAGDMIAAGLRADLCCVDTTQLDAGFAGRAFDQRLLDALPASVDPCGENGEFHTCVCAGPMFRLPLALQRGETVLREQRFTYVDYHVDH